jgi:PHD/YefM family antitoxin component YafN of YafNO toxin-antitoxin module
VVLKNTKLPDAVILGNMEWNEWMDMDEWNGMEWITDSRKTMEFKWTGRSEKTPRNGSNTVL